MPGVEVVKYSPVKSELPEPNQSFSDPVDAPYDPNDQEAWELTSELLERRLGNYYANGDNYRRAPQGSTHPGFQVEFPVEMSYTALGEGRLLSVIAKGVYRGNPSVWIRTLLGLALRNAQTGRLIAFESDLAIVQQPFESWQPDIFTTRGSSFEDPVGATRAVRHLRQAKIMLPLYC